MGGSTRWRGRAVIIGFTLVITGTYLAQALDSWAELNAATDDGNHWGLKVALAGHVLATVGFAWLGVSTAVTFRSWDIFLHPLTYDTTLPGGLRAMRRTMQQIDGKQPYHDFDVEQLRVVAKRRVALQDSRYSSGSLAVIVLFIGLALTPPDEGLVGQAIRVLMIAVLVVSAVGLIRGGRNRTDRKAEAFLERTQPQAAPAGEPT